MQNKSANAKEEWVAYCAQVLTRVTPLLRARGYELDTEQPHILGERFLTRPISGGRKLVLMGRRSKDGMRAVIKVSNEPRGIEELAHERRCRQVLNEIQFAYQTFSSPQELAFFEAGGFVSLITEFIEQERSFLARPLEEQFRFALAAFKAQEGAHATAYSHMRSLRRIFGAEEGATGYYIQPGEYRKTGAYAQDTISLIQKDNPIYSRLDTALDKTIEMLRDNEGTLDQYGGFLTHWDFIPQNFRIRDGKLYLLDHSSIRFGNKYEGWARFINFMTLYNPPLAKALIQYVALNRTPEESLALRLMRAHRLVELIRYYATWLSRTDGDLHTLTLARIDFWTTILESVLVDTPVASAVLDEYRTTRDRLRSPDEKLRQRGLH